MRYTLIVFLIAGMVYAGLGYLALHKVESVVLDNIKAIQK